MPTHINTHGKIVYSKCWYGLSACSIRHVGEIPVIEKPGVYHHTFKMSIDLDYFGENGPTEEGFEKAQEELGSIFAHLTKKTCEDGPIISSDPVSDGELNFLLSSLITGCILPRTTTLTYINMLDVESPCIIITADSTAKLPIPDLDYGTFIESEPITNIIPTSIFGSHIVTARYMKSPIHPVGIAYITMNCMNDVDTFIRDMPISIIWDSMVARETECLQRFIYPENPSYPMDIDNQLIHPMYDNNGDALQFIDFFTTARMMITAKTLEMVVYTYPNMVHHINCDFYDNGVMLHSLELFEKTLNTLTADKSSDIHLPSLIWAYLTRMIERTQFLQICLGTLYPNMVITREIEMHASESISMGKRVVKMPLAKYLPIGGRKFHYCLIADEERFIDDHYRSFTTLAGTVARIDNITKDGKPTLNYTLKVFCGRTFSDKKYEGYIASQYVSIENNRYVYIGKLLIKRISQDLDMGEFIRKHLSITNLADLIMVWNHGKKNQKKVFDTIMDSITHHCAQCDLNPSDVRLELNAVSAYELAFLIVVPRLEEDVSEN